MTFPCCLCGRCTARTNGGSLYCLDCASLPVEQRRAALERHLSLCATGWHLEDTTRDAYEEKAA